MARDDTRDGINKAAIAAAELVRALTEVEEGEELDADLKHDMVEGETDFFEAVEIALDEMDNNDILIAGLSEKIAQLSQRKTRMTQRNQRLKGLIDQAWQMADQDKHQFPTCTISPKKVPPKLIVTDESLIPAKYFKKPDPVLDKKALFDDIKADVDVPGATKSNGGKTIQIRKA